MTEAKRPLERRVTDRRHVYDAACKGPRLRRSGQERREGCLRCESWEQYADKLEAQPFSHTENCRMTRAMRGLATDGPCDCGLTQCPHCLDRDCMGEEFVKLVAYLHDYWLDHDTIPPSKFRPLLNLLDRAARAGMGTE